MFEAENNLKFKFKKEFEFEKNLKRKNKRKEKRHQPTGLASGASPIFSSSPSQPTAKATGQGHLDQAQLLWRKNKKIKRAAPWLGFEPTTYLSSPRPATTALLLLE